MNFKLLKMISFSNKVLSSSLYSIYLKKLKLKQLKILALIIRPLIKNEVLFDEKERLITNDGGGPICDCCLRRYKWL